GVEQFRCAMELAPHNISAHLGLASGLLGWSKDCIKSGAFGWAADLLQGSPYWFILVYRPVGVLLCTNVPCCFAVVYCCCPQHPPLLLLSFAALSTVFRSNVMTLQPFTALLSLPVLFAASTAIAVRSTEN
ncbi:hypothetical protein BHE74_00058442, partial [Ensete ventricosum]